MGVVADIERQLGRLRAREAADGMPDLRTSTMTHIVWCPPEWRPMARKTLAGLIERHPARTIFLVPEPGRETRVEAKVELKDFQLAGMSREVLSEVIELRLRGTAARHPGSVLLPLLVSDLPVFCRWRGRPAWGSDALTEVVGVVDRLVVDSAEWRDVPGSYAQLAGLFEVAAVSDLAFARTLPWRQALAARWPSIGSIERLRIDGPRAEAELLAGWLRSRLKREVTLTRRAAETVAAVWVDGEPVPVPDEPLGASELLSAELDQYGRDPVYEATVRAALPQRR